jgi:hypothetical protein
MFLIKEWRREGQGHGFREKQDSNKIARQQRWRIHRVSTLEDRLYHNDAVKFSNSNDESIGNQMLPVVKKFMKRVKRDRWQDRTATVSTFDSNEECNCVKHDGSEEIA